ncbi:hypothetical protein PR048_027464 [Dryococelus australis]|uniref:Uncharacterized protein n=1 Tax=Dryococelus australis TaxID=614101 RepID=A0ABQ9GFJ5_9NEOP|nr:hypothetical protein PR048_027464 [Dryococelus australis]
MYISKVDAEKTTANLSLYCDSCPGQNKNHVVLSMIAYTLKQLSRINVHHISIQATHTCPAIETNLKHSVGWAPSEWPTWIENVHTSPEPYAVYVMNYNDFKQWKPTEMMFLPPQRKGHVLGDKIKFKEVQQVALCKGSNSVEVKYSFREETPSKSIALGPQLVRGRPRKPDDVDLPKQLYKAKYPLQHKNTRP